MKNKPKYWKEYYGNKFDYLYDSSLLDRSRYYWNNILVAKRIKLLKKNINKYTSINLKKRLFSIKKKYQLSNFEIYLYENLNSTLNKFYKSCDWIK